MGNTPSKLIATVEVELQIIDNLNDYLFKILWNYIELFFRFIVYISEIFSLLKSCRIWPLK